MVGANVKLTNSGEQTSRESKSNTAGDFEFQNVKPGSYDILVTQQGFRGFSLKGISVVARQTVRVDADLQVGDVAQAVEVSAAVGVIATDSPAVASTLTPERILGLPVNVRGGGSTSPYALIATLPGVQSDNGSGYSIQGAVPAQTESSSDGISITAVTGNSPNRALFPSIESIAEIKVQGVGNNAEYGTPGDVTTISKSGSNAYHGAGFWYHQNKAFDSRAFNQVTRPAKIGNTFGVSVGGPLQLPKIYNGKNRTFFFFTWESFRFPRQTTITNTVPTLAMKSGDFNAEGITLKDPFTGLPVAGNRIPSTQINAVAQKVIPFYPDPNVGILTRQVQANFVETAWPISNRTSSTSTSIISSTRSMFSLDASPIRMIAVLIAGMSTPPVAIAL